MIVNDLTQLPFLRTCQMSDSLRGVDVEGVIISELMSDVLTCEEDGMLLISGLSTEQTIRTADIIGCSAIIISSGKEVTPAMVARASEANIPLFSSDLRNFQLVQELCQTFPDLKDIANG